MKKKEKKKTQEQDSLPTLANDLNEEPKLPGDYVLKRVTPTGLKVGTASFDGGKKKISVTEYPSTGTIQVTHTFSRKNKSLSHHETYADCAVRFFARRSRFPAGILCGFQGEAALHDGKHTSKRCADHFGIGSKCQSFHPAQQGAPAIRQAPFFLEYAREGSALSKKLQQLLSFSLFLPI